MTIKQIDKFSTTTWVIIHQKSIKYGLGIHIQLESKCILHWCRVSNESDIQLLNTKELMHCHCGTNNRAPRWTFTDPCKPEVRSGAREESASPVWLATPAMNARDTTKVCTIVSGDLGKTL